MNKHLFRVFTTVLFPAVAFAVDGVTLINQSTVLAAGGFPYTITTAGSYKLSGNLVASAGKQAILVAATNVVLDLAGFNVACTLGQNNTNQDFNLRWRLRRDTFRNHRCEYPKRHGDSHTDSELFG